MARQRVAGRLGRVLYQQRLVGYRRNKGPSSCHRAACDNGDPYRRYPGRSDGRHWGISPGEVGGQGDVCDRPSGIIGAKLHYGHLFHLAIRGEVRPIARLELEPLERWPRREPQNIHHARHRIGADTDGNLLPPRALRHDRYVARELHPLGQSQGYV